MAQLISTGYASTDEIHQMFVPGREGKVFDGTVIFDKPDSSNSFYIKRKDGKGYDLYVKHEDAFINTGIIENPEDYKSPIIYSSKKEATKFYENIK